MLASSIIIIARIRQQSKKLRSHDNPSANKESRVCSKTRNLAMMLIPVNIMFLLFVGPVVIAIYTYSDLGIDKLALVIVEVLSNCNFTLNFFVYFSTSSKFREEFYKVLDEVCKKLNLKKERSFLEADSRFHNRLHKTKRNQQDDMSKAETYSLTAAK